MNWLFLILSAASYFQDFPALQKEEKWREIVVAGEDALETATNLEAVQIHGQLASSYFYQGDFEEAERHASLCYEIACELDNPDQKVHGLYLLSAVARARGDFAEAKTIALEALLFSEGKLKAKVLFNLAAAETDDPKGNLEVAQKSLEDAYHLFDCPEDRQRTAIRLGKVYLSQGKMEQAQKLLAKTIPEIQSQRILMHAEYVSAQIEKAMGHLENARNLALSALVKAEELSAAKDAERIKGFYEGL